MYYVDAEEAREDGGSDRRRDEGTEGGWEEGMREGRWRVEGGLKRRQIKG